MWLWLATIRVWGWLCKRVALAGRYDYGFGSGRDPIVSDRIRYRIVATIRWCPISNKSLSDIG